MEGAHVLDRGGVQILYAADARPRIGMHVVGDHRQIEVEKPAIRLGEDAAPELLLHHIALGGESGRVDDQAVHPLGLREEHPLQMVGGDHLVIIGVIVIGGGVVEAADILGQPVEALRRQVTRRLEHDVLEQMGEARAAARIVLRADIVPDLHRDVGGVGVADRIDAQAVGQGPRRIVDRRDRGRGRRAGPLGKSRHRRQRQGGDGGAQDERLHWITFPEFAALLRPVGDEVK